MRAAGICLFGNGVRPSRSPRRWPDRRSPYGEADMSPRLMAAVGTVSSRDRELAVERAFVAAEEEQLVADDRAAHRRRPTG